ncbi:MAG: acyl-CoA dehydrogenase family protein [Acidimicrobiales bacterium]
MDFVLTDDDRALADAVRTLCAGKLSLSSLRAQEQRRAVDGAVWAALAETGVFALLVPESEGGLGLGVAQAAVVFEELGRALVPGPLAATVAYGSLATGGPGGPGASGAPGGGALVTAVRVPLRRGLPMVVEDLASAELLVVAADDGAQAYEVSALTSRPVEEGIDPLTPLWIVDALPVPVRRIGGAEAQALWECFAVLQAALLVGIAGATTEMAVDYTRTREQFGKPIGAFQAVKHLCADMLVRAETSRCAVQAAALTIDQPDVGDAERAVAGAALLAVEAALANSRSCVQVHGGMGFTWDVPVHLYLRRARVLGESLGPAASWARLVADRF